MDVSGASEQIELFISCRALRDLDFFGKSDPEVRVFLKTNGTWTLIGKTEALTDNLNPDFKKTINLDFIFETQQPLRFEVWDKDNVTADDIIGSVETSVGELMGARKQTSTLDLHAKGKKTTGKIIIKAEKIGMGRNVVFMQLAGVKLLNTDGFFGKSDPFFKLMKIRGEGDLLEVYRSEFIKNNLNPVWNHVKIIDDKLCGSDINRPFRIDVWDDQTDGKHRYIGYCDTTLAELKSGKNEFTLTNPKKTKAGTLKVLSFSIEERPSFIDYLRGGEQLSALVAIDFTGSNGIPSSPSSLHAMLPGGAPNEYQKAILSVCQIILNYDFDKMIPVYGFGGKPHFPALNMNAVSHCFPCTGDMSKQEVPGIQGILDTYAYALQNVELSGPTYFEPLIREAMKVCAMNKQNEADIYSIVLILTDGEIHDMNQTIDTLVEAAELPLSIIIIGVGNADFSKMEILDGDKGLKDGKGNSVKRDFVQFVPFRQFSGDMMLLAKRVLAELPEQLVDYKRLVNRKPRAPLH